MDYAATRTSPFSQILIQHIHGVAARIDPAATAAHALRGEQFLLGMIAAWEDDDAETHQSWVRAFWSDTRQFARAGTYVNFMSEDEGARVRSSYGPNYERLASIKAKYDPANVFRLNQNIKPAGQSQRVVDSILHMGIRGEKGTEALAGTSANKQAIASSRRTSNCKELL